MLYQLRIISFLVIIYSCKCDITTILKDNVKTKKEAVVKYMTQTIKNEAQTPDGEIKEEVSLAQTIQALGHPSVILRVYTGSVSKLKCTLNPGQVGKNTVMWFYSPTNLSFKPLQEDETIINKWNLTIYNTKFQHAGMYRCSTDRLHGGVVLLEVVDDEKYNVVKPLSSAGPYASKPVSLNSKLIMFSAWSEWSECSRCELVGRKRRYGICYIAPITQSKSSETKQNASIEGGILKVFHTFPGGIPCRSQILPLSLRNMNTIQTNKNEIMISLCKIKCKESIIKIRTGTIIETVNNSAGIYSLSQTKPPQTPLPARTIMYVEPGRRVLIKCLGTTLRDIPFTWKVDTQEISPRDLDERSNGRLHLNARDHIVLTSVLYSDAHVYSCWQDHILAGVVKLTVQRGAETTYRARFAVVVLIVIVTLLLRLTTRLVQYRQLYLGTT